MAIFRQQRIQRDESDKPIPLVIHARIGSYSGVGKEAVLQRTGIAALATFAFWVAPISFAGIQNYAGRVTLNPNNAEVAEALTIGFVAPAEGADHCELNLNKDLAVAALSCPRCSAYREGSINDRTNTRPIVVTFRPMLHPGERADIQFETWGKITDVSSDSNSFSPEWVELSIDSGWYPYEQDSRGFVFDLQVKIDPVYKLVGNGRVTGGNGTWRLLRRDRTSDIDVAAARAWKSNSIKLKGFAIKIISVDVPRAIAEVFAQRSTSAATIFTDWFGTAPVHDLTIVLNPRRNGSSYSRPGYVSLAYSPEPAELERLLFNLTHEVAHFWWSGAPSGTWENWLNEAFAEYSALLYVRKFEGIDTFDKLMSQRAERAKSQPPIWGVDRGTRNYAIVIYAKGALRLQQLEGMLGTDKFRKLLATLVRKHIKTTHDFLDELQAEGSIEIRLKFEELLKT